MVAQKNVIRAYWLAFVGLLCGIVGMHRFYLELYFTGTLMLLIFLGGIFCFAIGLAHMFAPFAAAVAAGSDIASFSLGGALPQDHNALTEWAGKINTSELPESPTSNLAQETKLWFVSGWLFMLAALCWLLLDCIFMSSLTKKANES